jgi:hypothetical protein
LLLDNIIDATIGVIGSFSLGECDDRTISSIAAELKTASFPELTEEEGNVRILVVQRIPDSVVKGDAQGRVRVFAAFAAFKEIFLDILDNWENITALLIGDDGPISAGSTGDESGCELVISFDAV